MNSEKQHIVSSEQIPAAQAEFARGFIFADIMKRLGDLMERERGEIARHQQAVEIETEKHNEEMATIKEAMQNVEVAVVVLKNIYSELNHSKVTTTNDLHDSVKDYFARLKQNDPDADKPKRKKNTVFGRGELRETIMRVLHERDTFLNTDEVIEGVRKLIPNKQFDDKLVADGLKDGRKNNLVGVPVLRGNFHMMLNAIPSFYEMDETGKTVVLKPGYAEKLHHRLQELGLTLAGSENDYVSGGLFDMLEDEHYGLIETMKREAKKEKSTAGATAVD